MVLISITTDLHQKSVFLAKLSNKALLLMQLFIVELLQVGPLYVCCLNLLQPQEMIVGTGTTVLLLGQQFCRFCKCTIGSRQAL